MPTKILWQIKIDPTWLPTPEGINALPEPLANLLSVTVAR
jgi:hypothetical protein